MQKPIFLASSLVFFVLEKPVILMFVSLLLRAKAIDDAIKPNPTSAI